MNDINPPVHRVTDEEAEKASFSYLMSTMILMVGLPLPIINLLATWIFYLGNRKKTYFVRFHCLQALYSQLLIILMNSAGLSWTLSIVYGDNRVSDVYFAYLITLFILNALEIIATVYASIATRKRKDVRFFLFGPFVELICRPDKVVKPAYSF